MDENPMTNRVCTCDVPDSAAWQVHRYGCPAANPGNTTTSDRGFHPGWITRDEMERIIEQINRARRLEMTANFESGRRYERELMRGQTTGQDGVTVKLDWEDGTR
jgi:hypothetical protein